MSFLFQENRVDLFGNSIPKYNTKFHRAAAFVCRRDVASTIMGFGLMGASFCLPQDFIPFAHSGGMMLGYGGAISVTIERVARTIALCVAGFTPKEIKEKCINKKPTEDERVSKKYDAAADYLLAKHTERTKRRLLVTGGLCLVSFGHPVSIAITLCCMGPITGEDMVLMRQWKKVLNKEWVIEDKPQLKEIEPVGARAKQIKDKMLAKMPKPVPVPSPV